MDIKALLGHESVATTQIYPNVGQERMAWRGGERRVGNDGKRQDMILSFLKGSVSYVR